MELKRVFTVSLILFLVLNLFFIIQNPQAKAEITWITPSSVHSFCGEDPSNPATYTIDGDVITPWWHTATCYHWIIVDMGIPHTITQLRLYQANSAIYRFGKDIGVKIYVGNNPTDLGDPIWEGRLDAGSGWQETDFFEKNGRYVKVESKSNYHYMELYEINAFAEEEERQNFGYETKGELFGSAIDYIRGSWYTCPSSGTANNIAVYCYFEWTSGEPGVTTVYLKASIYYKNQSLVASTDELSFSVYKGSPQEGWWTLSFSGSPSLKAVDYYLVLWARSAPQLIMRYYWSGAVDKSVSRNIPYDGWPDPLSGSTANGNYSIYCSYTVKEEELREESFTFTNLMNITSSAYSWRAKTLTYTETVTSSGILQIWRAYQISFSESSTIDSLLADWREKGLTFTQAVTISSLLKALRERQLSFDETITLTDLLTFLREKQLVFDETVIPTSLLETLRAKGFIYFEKTETITVDDVLLLLREKGISFDETLSVDDLLEILKALKITYAEFLETIEPTSETVYIKQYIIPLWYENPLNIGIVAFVSFCGILVVYTLFKRGTEWI